MTRPIVSPKTSAAEAEARLPKNFGIGRLCSASVILWLESHLAGNSDFNKSIQDSFVIGWSIYQKVEFLVVLAFWHTVVQKYNRATAI